MKHWSMFKALAQLTGALLSAAVLSLVSLHLFQKAGISPALVCTALLAAGSLAIPFWNRIFRRLPQGSGHVPAVDDSRRRLSDRLAGLVVPLCYISLIWTGIAYLAATQVLENAIVNLPADEPPAFAREYLDDLAGIERMILGPSGSAAVYFPYGMRQLGERKNFQEADWALRKAVADLGVNPKVNRASLARALNGLATIAFSRGDLNEAAASFRESILVTGDSISKKDTATGTARVQALLGMARICQAKRESKPAEAFFNAALQAAKAVEDPDSDDAVDALLGLAQVRQNDGGNPKTESLLNDAAQRAERMLKRKTQAGASARDEQDRLVTALTLKAQVLRVSHRNREADAIDKHIDEIQWNRRPHLKLDEALQARIVETVENATGWLLSIKYGTRQRDEGRTRLSENLTAHARRHLDQLPWYGIDRDPSQIAFWREEAPDMVEANIGQISVRSPDSAGLLMVEVRGRSNLHIANQSLNGEPFAFAYRIRPPASTSPRIPIEDVEELNPLSSLE